MNAHNATYTYAGKSGMKRQVVFVNAAEMKHRIQAASLYIAGSIHNYTLSISMKQIVYIYIYV